MKTFRAGYMYETSTVIRYILYTQFAELANIGCDTGGCLGDTSLLGNMTSEPI